MGADDTKKRGPSARTIKAVVDAGYHLLGTEGLGSLTPQRIHQVSGVARTTVYRHWPTPESVLESIVDHASTDSAPVPATDNLWADLESALHLVWSRFEDRSVRALIGALLLIDSTDHDTPRHGTRNRRLLDEFAAPVMEVIRRAQSEGTLTEGHPGILADELIAPVFYRYVGLGLPPDDPHITWTITSFMARRSTARDISRPSEWAREG